MPAWACWTGGIGGAAPGHTCHNRPRLAGPRGPGRNRVTPVGLGRRAVVNFFVCGVQKGGTTALDRHLRDHPAIEMARVKEVHFFDDESVSWNAPDYAPLHGFFAAPHDSRRRGEATPIYTYWPRAMERLRAYNPAAKLIMLLRHPVCRAFSHWRMEASRGAEALPFAEAIRPAARERVRLAPAAAHRVFSYVERGFYAPQVDRLLSLFSRGQVLFLRTDALWGDPSGTLRTVHSFLDVPPGRDAERRYTVPVQSDRSVPLPREDAEYLAALYRDDILTTQSLTGLDLHDWLSPDSSAAEPMRP